MARLHVNGGAEINPALAAAGCGVPVAAPVAECMDGGFLLLLLLFILLAAGPSWGIDNNFFFIIILAIIGLGGFRRTFGFGGAAV
ncbi:MAG: hypothetical protein ACM3TR_09340 [Caulobacteraceae bacterium]